MINSDKPDAIDFEQRRIGPKRYESIPRRKSDMALFSQLTAKQQSAYDRIEEGRNYEMSGLPIARARYSDAPGGGELYELTPRQLEVLFDYREWRDTLFKEAPALLYAVISYMSEKGLKDVEKSLRIDRGKAARYISIGLNRYCMMKGWGDQEQNCNMRRVKITGWTDGTEFKKFECDYLNEVGNPVAHIEPVK
jgi:hypothetical protein